MGTSATACHMASVHLLLSGLHENYFYLLSHLLNPKSVFNNYWLYIWFCYFLKMKVNVHTFSKTSYNQLAALICIVWCNGGVFRTRVFCEATRCSMKYTKVEATIWTCYTFYFQFTLGHWMIRNVRVRSQLSVKDTGLYTASNSWSLFLVQVATNGQKSCSSCADCLSSITPTSAFISRGILTSLIFYLLWNYLRFPLSTPSYISIRLPPNVQTLLKVHK